MNGNMKGPKILKERIIILCSDRTIQAWMAKIFMIFLIKIIKLSFFQKFSKNFLSKICENIKIFKKIYIFLTKFDNFESNLLKKNIKNRTNIIFFSFESIKNNPAILCQNSGCDVSLGKSPRLFVEATEPTGALSYLNSAPPKKKRSRITKHQNRIIPNLKLFGQAKIKAFQKVLKKYLKKFLRSGF